MEYWNRFQSALKGEQRRAEIERIARELGCTYRTLNQETGEIDIGLAIQNIYNYLQTEMMSDSCNKAKWACFWAAVAAIVACVSIILTLCMR
jgi:hypothetical protein